MSTKFASLFFWAAVASCSIICGQFESIAFARLHLNKWIHFQRIIFILLSLELKLHRLKLTWQAEYCEIFSSFFSLDHVSVANESEVNVDEDAAIVFVFWLLKNLYLFFDDVNIREYYFNNNVVYDYDVVVVDVVNINIYFLNIISFFFQWEA